MEYPSRRVIHIAPTGRTEGVLAVSEDKGITLYDEDERIFWFPPEWAAGISLGNGNDWVETEEGEECVSLYNRSLWGNHHVIRDAEPQSESLTDFLKRSIEWMSRVADRLEREDKRKADHDAHLLRQNTAFSSVEKSVEWHQETINDLVDKVRKLTYRIEKIEEEMLARERRRRWWQV